MPVGGDDALIAAAVVMGKVYIAEPTADGWREGRLRATQHQDKDANQSSTRTHCGHPAEGLQFMAQRFIDFTTSSSATPLNVVHVCTTWPPGARLHRDVKPSAPTTDFGFTKDPSMPTLASEFEAPPPTSTH